MTNGFINGATYVGIVLHWVSFDLRFYSVLNDYSCAVRSLHRFRAFASSALASLSILRSIQKYGV
jgi:hypothetical protein